MKEIFVTVKNVYGVEKVYPVGEEAEAFAAIAGTKTLTESTIKGIKALGYKITIASSLSPASILS